MVISNLQEMLIGKCEIYYGAALISREKIIEEYAKFFSETVTVKAHTVSFALHTGSKCFNFISVVIAALACFIHSIASNDDVIANLYPGDIVMYRNKRCRWISPECEFKGETYMVLEQDGKGKNGNLKQYVPIKNKYLIKPYYGTSKTTDGRGVRKKKSSREDFLSYVFDTSIEEVPSVTETAVVIVANRSDFWEIYKNIRIVYAENKHVMLHDIVPAAYYTSGGEEYQYGGNPTKAEPVLKVVGNTTNARDIVLNKNSNRVIGLLVTKVDSLTENSSELADLLRRKSLRFIHVTTPIKAEICEKILDMYEDAEVFACTKDYLTKNAKRIKSENSFTLELQRQVLNIMNNTVSRMLVFGGWSWETYKQIKQELSIIRKSNWTDEIRDNFLLSAYRLLNLFTTANFTMEKLETMVEQGRLNPMVKSPKDQISDLRSMAEKVGMMEDRCIFVVDAIEKKYNELRYHSPKEERMYAYLEQHKDDKIAMVVPKAYYSDVVSINTYKNVVCVTANQFNADMVYDAILVVGDIVGKKFDPLQCRSARMVDILLYECEEKTFCSRKKKQDRFEQKLNAKIGKMRGETVDILPLDAENDVEIVDEDLVQEFHDLEEYIEGIGSFDIRKLMSGVTTLDANATVSEVKYIGTFVTGEQIFFSKNYSAVVFDYENGTVIETAVDKLIPGNILVFSRRDNYTRNIVDDIYEKLNLSGKLSPEIIDASEKAFYWKKVLKEYKEERRFTYRSIAQQLRTVGCSIQEVTVRQWLVEESHIVGPRDMKTMEAIAKISQDSNLLRDAKGYFEACRIVRHERRSILDLIEKAINDKLSGHISSENGILKIVYDNVDNLSQMYELEYVSELDNSANININLVNRPIAETEVLL